ncbi:MAG: hypothetical protein QME51_05785, partial [Planctomycetota bacterium]|nr:hypothetical protein [Planctomycetota bacterium]
ALRILRFGQADDLFSEASDDSKMAKYENKQMAQGQPQEVNFWDDHKTHILEVLKPIKSPLFKQKDQRIQEIFVQHLKTHQDAVMPLPAQQPVGEELPPEIGAPAPIGAGM